MLEVAQAVQHDHPLVSLHEEMVRRQLEEEERQRRIEGGKKLISSGKAASRQKERICSKRLTLYPTWPLYPR